MRRDPKQTPLAPRSRLDAAVIANVGHRRGGGRGRVLPNGRRARNETRGGRILSLGWAARNEVLAQRCLVERKRVLGALDRAVPEILAQRLLHLALPGGRVAQGFAGAVRVVAGGEGRVVAQVAAARAALDDGHKAAPVLLVEERVQDGVDARVGRA